MTTSGDLPDWDVADQAGVALAVLRRTDTVSQIARDCGIDPHVVAVWVETFLRNSLAAVRGVDLSDDGPWEGKSLADLRDDLPEDWEAWLADETNAAELHTVVCLIERNLVPRAIEDDDDPLDDE